MEKQDFITALEEQGYRQKNIFDEHVITMFDEGEKVYVITITKDVTKEDAFYLFDAVHKVTHNIRILSPNEDMLYNKAKAYFFRWIQHRFGGVSHEEIKGKLTLSVSSVQRMKKTLGNKWDTIAF